MDFVDANTAVACCDVDCTGVLADSAKATFVGATYTDRVERRSGVWKIKQRDVVIHYFNSFENTELSKPIAQ